MSHASNFIKGYLAQAAVTANRIVKFGATDGSVLQSAAAADASIGVSSGIDSDIGEMCDVTLLGLADVRLGGAVTRGDWLVSDANGKAVVAAPAAAANANVVGRALASGVLDDIVLMVVAPNSRQG